VKNSAVMRTARTIFPLLPKVNVFTMYTALHNGSEYLRRSDGQFRVLLKIDGGRLSIPDLMYRVL